MNLLLEWLPREGHLIGVWWLWMTLAGAAVFPLCFRLLGALPDKGYTLARAVGMMLVTFVFWLLASYGFLDNSVGSIVLSWLLVLGLAALVYARGGDWRDILGWWRENRLLVLAAELLFLGLFALWAIYRAHQNQLTGTEKPMELAFMSAVQRSQSFPPNDPWLSGYAISYYYKGYVMSAMLSMLSGITSAIGFNLTAASQFALTGLTAFGVAYNLVRCRASSVLAIAAGGLAAFLMVFVGNFQTAFIEIPFQSKAAPQAYLDYWGTPSRSHFPEGGYPHNAGAALISDLSQWDYWWWFRASRVLADYDLQGQMLPGWHAHPISEFPAFSFLLGDNHPHVLALPFAIMAIGLMLNRFLAGRRPNRPEILLYGLAIGGLAFLNTWDAPIYFLGLLAAEALRRLLHNARGRLTFADLWQLGQFGLMLAGTALLAYLPFWLGFRSQAGGLLPNLLHPTLFRRFFIMFGPLILILSIFLLTETWRGFRSRAMNWRFGLSAGGLTLLGLLGVMLILTAMSAISPTINAYVQGFLNDWGGWEAVLPWLLQRRLEFGMTTVSLLAAIILICARLFPPVGQARADAAYPPASGFALLLIGMGLCLTLFPEFLYLKDNFNTRINTIFKFYYQTWALWSIGGAYAVYSVIADRRLPRPAFMLRVGAALAVTLALAAGLIYTAFGVYHRALVEPAQRYVLPAHWNDPIPQVSDGMMVEAGAVLYSDGSLRDNPQTSIVQAHRAGMASLRGDAIIVRPALTLDGGASMIDGDDYRVIVCLSDLVEGDGAVAVEAVRDAYSAYYGRVGALTGIPIVLGWENHERQWRGSTYEAAAGTRRADIDKLYSALDMDLVADILKRYGISYILYGATERGQYGGGGEGKFIDSLPVVCEAGNSRIFFVHPDMR